MQPTIHIIDDEASYRTSLARLVETYGFIALGYASGEEFLEGPPKPQTGCILLDLRMPGLSGPELQERLAQAAPLLPVIFLTGQGTIADGVEAMKGGAEDFLEKPVPSKVLRNVIEHALVQNEARCRERDQADDLRARAANLTPREIQVFHLVVRGERNKQVAYALNTSERTVKAHRHSIMEKLKLRSFAEMVSLAERLSRVEPPAASNATPEPSPKANIQHR